MDEVTGEWRRLHNEELYALYSSPHIIREVEWGMRWAGHAECMDEKRNAYRVLVVKPKRKRTLAVG